MIKLNKNRIEIALPIAILAFVMFFTISNKANAGTVCQNINLQTWCNITSITLTDATKDKIYVGDQFIVLTYLWGSYPVGYSNSVTKFRLDNNYYPNNPLFASNSDQLMSSIMTGWGSSPNYTEKTITAAPWPTVYGEYVTAPSIAGGHIFAEEGDLTAGGITFTTGYPTPIALLAIWPSTVSGGDIDIGLRISNGNKTTAISGETVIRSPVTIAKNGVVYGIRLVDPSDPLSSGVTINVNGTLKALKKYTP